ncbi:MAG: transposase, partial [Arenicella sp.]|nr:transposase [Arenicella sp.]
MTNGWPHAKNLRKFRNSKKNQFYFLTSTVANRRPIFINQHCAQIMLEAFRWMHSTHRFFLQAAVVMPDHIHIVGQLGEGDLAGLMHSLKSYTANQLAATGVNTPVWQAGYHDHELLSDEDFKTKVAYVLNNP